MTDLIPLRLRVSNAFLLLGDAAVLVDAGNLGEYERLVRSLAAHGLAPGDLDLVLLTHGHPDHFGDAPRLREAFGVPIAVHARDADLLRAGRAPTLRPVTLLGRALRPLFAADFAGFEPDLEFEEFDLRAYGVAGTVLHTPGHTPGSVSVLLDGGQAILGDLLRGGFVRRDTPATHLFADDSTVIDASLSRVLEWSVTTAFFGHGRPASGAALRRFAEKRRAEQRKRPPVRGPSKQDA